MPRCLRCKAGPEWIEGRVTTTHEQQEAWKALRTFLFANQDYSVGDLLEFNIELLEELDAALDT